MVLDVCERYPLENRGVDKVASGLIVRNTREEYSRVKLASTDVEKCLRWTT